VVFPSRIGTANVLLLSKLLPEPRRLVGDPAVRNRGTIGGNVAHADPASDLPTVLQTIAGTAARVCGATDGVAFLVVEGRLRIMAHHGAIDIIIGEERGLDRATVSGTLDLSSTIAGQLGAAANQGSCAAPGVGADDTGGAGGGGGAGLGTKGGTGGTGDLNDNGPPAGQGQGGVAGAQQALSVLRGGCRGGDGGAGDMQHRSPGGDGGGRRRAQRGAARGAHPGRGRAVAAGKNERVSGESHGTGPCEGRGFALHALASYPERTHPSHIAPLLSVLPCTCLASLP